MRINMGCDKDIKKGWVNLDCYDHEGVNVVWDLNDFSYPFKDNSVEQIYMHSVLEHLDNPLKVLNELWRICMNGAVIEIFVPYFTSYTPWTDITHKRAYSYDTFSACCGFSFTERDITNGYTPILFNYLDRKLIWGNTRKKIFKPVCSFMNWLVNLSPMFMERRIPFLIPIEYLYVKLEVRK